MASYIEYELDNGGTILIEVEDSARIWHCASIER